MSLLASGGELKNRPGRFGIIFGTLTGAYILVAMRLVAGCGFSRQRCLGDTLGR